MTTLYECIRCNKEFDQKGHYKAHISRKKPCGESSQIIPTMQNVKLIRRVEGGGKNITIHVDNNTGVVNNTVDNSTVVHNHTNTVNLVGFGEEDLTFVTPKFIASLLRIHEEDQDAVSDLMKVVHFNPAKPENMNICADESTFNLFKDGRWNECKHDGDSAMHVAQRYADKILRHIEHDDVDKDIGIAQEERAEAFQEFHKHMHRAPDIERAFIDFIRKHSCMVTCKNDFGEFVIMVPKVLKK